MISAQSPSAALGPPSAQSPFAARAVLPPCRRHPASPRGTLLPLHRSYGLMRQTCCPPGGFGIASHAGSLQVAVSPCWAQALPVVISANPSLRVWTSTPAAPRVHVPVTSPRTLAFPGEATGRRDAKSPTATSVGGNITELQSFTNVQTHKFARHTGSSHPCVLRRRAAVAFTSAPIRARYLPLQRICFPSKTGQLTEGGLPPPKIGSLDGCSPNPACMDSSRDATGRARTQVRLLASSASWPSRSKRLNA